MFDAEIGGQVAWLLPAALILLAAGLVFTRRAPRTDRTRAAAAAVGRLAAGYRPGVQLHAGDLPRLLHGRAGAGDRRPGRDRRGAALASTGPGPGPGHPGRHARRDGALVVRAAAPQRGLVAGSAGRRSGPRVRRCRGTAGGRVDVPPGGGGSRRRRPAGRHRRAGGVRGQDGVHPACRLHPVRGPAGGRCRLRARRPRCSWWWTRRPPARDRRRAGRHRPAVRPGRCHRPGRRARRDGRAAAGQHREHRAGRGAAGRCERLHLGGGGRRVEQRLRATSSPAASR